MDAKYIKEITIKILFGILLAVLFVSLLAQRLFHPR
jgi:hypothetical protein